MYHKRDDKVTFLNATRVAELQHVPLAEAEASSRYFE